MTKVCHDRKTAAGDGGFGKGLAEPGGICLSGAAHEQVRDKVDLAFQDLGGQSLKNIARPVTV
jgi:class 3 adenylate cyclase